MQTSIAKNPNNMAAFQLFVHELFLRGKFHDGEQIVWLWLGKLPPGPRREVAEKLGLGFESEGKHAEAIRAWGIAAWIFATSPDPKLRNAQAALALAQRIVQITKAQDPLALDTFAAAAAATGHFDDAIRAAQQAISLANSQGNKALAEAIAVRLPYYQRRTPYVSRPDGSDRP